MKELFRFTSIRKFDNLHEPCGKINIDDVHGKYYSLAIAAKTKSELEGIVKGFINSGLSLDPLLINPHLKYIYEGLAARKKCTVEKVEELCKGTYGSDVKTFVADEQFKDAKSIIVENLYFLIQEKKKEHSEVKVLFKHLLKVIGLLEAIANNNRCLKTILQNPSLQYYLFKSPKNYFKPDDIKEKDKDNRQNSYKETIKKDYEDILTLKDAERELLDLHSKLKSDFDRKKSEIDEEDSDSESSSKGFLSTIFKCSKTNKSDKLSELLTNNPLLTSSKHLSDNTKKVIQPLGVDSNSFEPLDVLDAIHEEIVLKSNSLNSLLSKPRFISYQGKTIPTGYINKLSKLGFSQSVKLEFFNWIDNEISFDVPPNAPPVPTSHGFAKILGEGRLLRVEEEYKGCELGNLSSVVNIPPNSKKELKDRLLVKQVSIGESETSTDSTDETTTESREQNNMSSESEKIQKFDMSLQAGLNVSASYGPTVGVEASSDFTTSVSSSETSKSASSYAKDITSRAVKKIEQRIRAFQRTEKTTENEITNTESFDNPKPTPAVGIYQWINEVYKARLVQYDSRLQIEFMVPEPGNLLLHASNSPNPKPNEEELIKPIFDITVDDIDSGTYRDLVSKYDASDVTPPPPPTHTLTKAYNLLDAAESDKLVNFSFKDDSITIPDGYRPDWIRAFMAASRSQHDDASFVSVTICHDGYSFGDPRRKDRPAAKKRRKQFYFNVKSNYRNIPIALTGRQDRSFTFTVTVKCYRTDEALDKWKLETYTKLRQAYQKQLDDYNDKVALSRQRSFFSGSSGSNPDKNRAIEKDELKRACISILTNQSFELFDSINDPGDRIPTIFFDQVKPEGDYIRFFENSFEWTQQTYILYPYFWANPDKTWLRSLNIGLNDPKHEEFLKSGYARVVVPVRPEFQNAILQYLESGVIWDGRNPDDIDLNDPMYVKISTEIMERQGHLQQTPEIEDTWEYKVPTNIQIISNGLPLPLPQPFL